jgi:hypothetical protein
MITISTARAIAEEITTQATLERMKDFAWIRPDLTDEEKVRYGLYATMPGFLAGFNDYNDRQIQDMGDGVLAQSYDRGAECAMRRQRIQFKSAGAVRTRT